MTRLTNSDNHRNRLFECVPNFSEGNRSDVIEEISRAFSKDSLKLLDIDSSTGANRSVITCAGEGFRLIEAAFDAIEIASRLIDLRYQKGTHPRFGATDVFPFVPLIELDENEKQKSRKSILAMRNAIELSHLLGSRVGDELGIPVFMYENSARDSTRKDLPFIRKGGFEALQKRMQSGELLPDYGPGLPHPTAGAIAIGARSILIAFNINLATRSKETAREIARDLRKTRDLLAVGTNRRIAEQSPLSAMRAIGWYAQDFDCAQVSFNLTDFRISPLLEIFETTSAIARAKATSVTGCEIVGMVPLEALLECARTLISRKEKDKRADYAKHQSSVMELVNLAITTLGLDKSKDFQPEKKILELALEDMGL